MTSVLETLGLKNSSGQTFADLVHKQTDSALRDLLRHYADDDPDFAARLSRYFDEMKKKDVPPVA